MLYLLSAHSSILLRSPTHAGGLFAMDRNYFMELGGYDPGLQIWGGENFELSFKVFDYSSFPLKASWNQYCCLIRIV